MEILQVNSLSKLPKCPENGMNEQSPNPGCCTAAESPFHPCGAPPNPGVLAGTLGTECRAGGSILNQGG